MRHLRFVMVHMILLDLCSKSYFWIAHAILIDVSDLLWHLCNILNICWDVLNCWWCFIAFWCICMCFDDILKLDLVVFQYDLKRFLCALVIICFRRSYISNCCWWLFSFFRRTVWMSRRYLGRLLYFLISSIYLGCFVNLYAVSLHVDAFVCCLIQFCNVLFYSIMCHTILN